MAPMSGDRVAVRIIFFYFRHISSPTQMMMFWIKAQVDVNRGYPI